MSPRRKYVSMGESEIEVVCPESMSMCEPRQNLGYVG